MTTNSSGAVFFLGTRAHYQVLQQPEARLDAENGNESTESIYQNPSVDNSGNYIGERNLSYCDNEVNGTEEKELVNGIKKRSKRRQSEAPLCDKDIEMKPSLLNSVGESETPKTKSSKRRINLLTYLASLYKRKKRLDTDQIQYLKHLESALQTCTYRECCRCLDCQSRYFDVDESDYSSDDSDYGADYTSYYVPPPPPPPEEEDDEVFIDTAPGDNTSTDLLLETKETPKEPVRDMSLSSEEELNEQALDIEVAAGTPVLLNYLLTHPITCNIILFYAGLGAKEKHGMCQLLSIPRKS